MIYNGWNNNQPATPAATVKVERLAKAKAELNAAAPATAEEITAETAAKKAVENSGGIIPEETNVTEVDRLLWDEPFGIYHLKVEDVEVARWVRAARRWCRQGGTENCEKVYDVLFVLSDPSNSTYVRRLACELAKELTCCSQQGIEDALQSPCPPEGVQQ